MNQEIYTAGMDSHSNTTNHVVHTVLRFLWLLRRRKSIVLGSLALAGVLGMLYFTTATRVYEAKAQILVRYSQPDSVSVQMMADRNTQDQMATFERLLTSNVILNRALGLLETLPPEIPRTATREEALEQLREMLSARRFAARASSN